jgi:hypothetical protein
MRFKQLHEMKAVRSEGWVCPKAGLNKAEPKRKFYVPARKLILVV